VNQATANVFAHNIRITQPESTAPFDAKFSDGTGAAIRFVLSDRADSVIVMINVGDSTIRTLKGTGFVSGDTLLVWDGNDADGTPVASGDYGGDCRRPPGLPNTRRFSTNSGNLHPWRDDDQESRAEEF
jgi:hypothetical protein